MFPDILREKLINADKILWNHKLQDRQIILKTQDGDLSLLIFFFLLGRCRHPCLQLFLLIVFILLCFIYFYFKAKGKYFADQSKAC